MKTENLAKLAVALAGICWGVLWIPLRSLNGVGIDKFWAFVTFSALPALMVAPLFILRWKQHRDGGMWLILTGLALGLTQFFYSLSVLHTEIVRAMVLFYLNPVWAMLLARYFLGEAITPIRWTAIAVAFVGMAIILHVETEIPWPRNDGDWFACAAGIAWASGTVLLRRHQNLKPLDLFPHNFIWTGIFLVPLVLAVGLDNAPPLSLFVSQLWWVLPFIVCVWMAGAYISMWAVPKLAPAVVGVLFMTEISAAAITSSLLSGEPFGWRETIGIMLITIASILESVRDLWRQRGALA
jgi:drug/metabolite transporter (DMT)-like permease